ncbi:hypothetical protein BOX15_Mlig016789g1 [Macrostomum lignano]|uniref:Uncharacterized protein n=1 Tax=Macrostomum lignano TaxID=282301 RepID=A0A267DXV6_9PLAT|nr:hypothetical protein BOX15_Mlig016789g1 [Macrostomum lignano]
MCQSDLCACTKSDESCLCGLYNHIGHMCSARKIVVDWKKELPECGASCPSGMVWKPCVDYCKYSCSALSLGNRCDSSDVCVAGCVCPNGQVQHEGRCVSVSECKCEFDGRDFPPGTSVSKGNETCECNYGEWHCKPGPCPGCDSICPQGKEYTPCRSNCPATCATGLGGVGCNQTCDRDGCQCPPGMVEDDKGECKRPEDCTCSHNGKDYKEGDVIQHPSCIDCVCKRSKWDCNRRPSCASMCSVWGLGHFETFDGAQYSVKGRCEYVLTQSADWEAGGSIDRMRFRILASFTSCSTSGATCIGYVMVQYKLAKSFLLKSFAMRSRNMIWEDAQSSITHDHGTVLRHTTDKLFSIVHLVDIGVTVYFDQQSRVYISLDDRHRENVRGLCGTFDNDQKTDFVGPASNMIIDRVPEFVDKWKTRAACPNAELLVDNCDAVKDRETWAKTRCKEVLLDHVNISKCHAMVDPMPFYENCVQDSCLCDKGGDCECFCANVAHYVQKCNQVGVHVHWRSQTICPMQCDEDCDHVTPCKSVCPPKTCLNKDRHDELLRDTACQDLMCIEGCESEPCPPGTVLHEGKCVNESICECTCRFNGRDYGEGERITDPEVCDPCQNCFCGCNNTLVKTGDPCTTSGPSTVSTATPATPFPPLCDTTGWTRWMNASSPISGDGDYEIIPNLRRHYQFCEVDDISKVDYKALEPVDPAEVDKQVKQIGKSVGLVCKNSQQIAHARCFDYAVRFYCVCGVTSPTSSSPPESSSTPSTTKSTWSTWSTFTASTTESIWSTLSTRTSTSPTTESTWPRWNTSTPQPSTTTATEGTTTPQGACEDGWTQWININKPTTGLQGGESESLPEIERQLGKICAGGKIEQIQCRDVSVHRQNIGYNTQFGQCSLANGLRCLNKDQAGLSSTKQCYDYEVRFFCRCSPNVCPPPTVERGIVWELPDSAFAASSFRGKDPMHGPQRARINTKKDSSGYGAWTADTKDSTPWIEVQVPEALQFVGLRTQGRQDMHQFVNEFTVEVSEDCRNFQPILGGKPLDANVDQNMAVTNYFSRDLQTVTAKCIRLHPKRFYGSASVRLDLIQCETRSTPTELPTTTASSSISPTTSCYYDDCAMKCTLICHYFDSKLKEIGYCSSNSSNCVPGCKTIDCPDGFYKSRDECVREEQCPCMDDQGREVPPGTIWDVEECKYKICRNNTVEQVIIPGCEPSTTAFTPQNNRTRPYTPSATPRTSTVCEEWTDWINLDNPSTGEGDIETIDKARDRWPGFCPQPISIQCRDSDSKKDVTDIPQELICDVNQGLVCKNEHQYPTKCLDFEVRYFCECFDFRTQPTRPTENSSTSSRLPEESTTSPRAPEESTTSPRAPEESTTSPRGPEESTTSPRAPEESSTSPRGPEESSTSPRAPEESTTSPRAPEESSTSSRVPEESTTSPRAPEESSPSKATGLTGFTTTPEREGPSPTTSVCEEWTPWINLDRPSTGHGDVETMEKARRKWPNFCPKPMKIQCRDAGSKISVDQVSQELLCDLEHGLLCINENQYPNNCNDYEIRFYCDCYEKDISTSPSQSPETPSPRTPSEAPETPSPRTPSQSPETPSPRTPSQSPETPSPRTPSQSPETPSPRTPSQSPETPSPRTPSQSPETPSPRTPSQSPETPSPRTPSQSPETPSPRTPSQSPETPSPRTPSQSPETPSPRTPSQSPETPSPRTPSQSPETPSPRTPSQSPETPSPRTPSQSPETPSPRTPSQSPETPSPRTPSEAPETPSPRTPSQSPETPSPRTPSQSPETPSPRTPSQSPETPSPRTPSQSPENPSPRTPSQSPETPSPRTPSQSPETPSPRTPSQSPETPSPRTPSQSPETPSPRTPSPYTPSATPGTSTVCEEWTDWINLDNPSTGEGDIETIDKARDRWPGFCPQPISIQCRDSDSKKDVTDIPQELICDVNQGLVCKNEHQYPTKCLDYEVRYFCECFETQTPSVSTRTQSPRTVTQETTIVTKNKEETGETATTKERPTPPTWSTPPPGVCPGVNDTSLCPARCPAPLMCDGLSCVEECPCIIEGRRIKPGHVIKTSDCQLCTCISNGIYHCTPFVCPSCPPGKQLISSGPPSCECECEEGTTAGGSTTASGSPTAGGSSATTSAIFTTSKEPSLTTTGPRGVCVYLSNQTENVYRDANRPTDLIQIELEIGDVRKEGKCRVCICYERSGQEPELVCKDTACPPVRDFECAVQSRAQPGECCPTWRNAAARLTSRASRST